jgi:hypothetical protein
VTSGPGSYTTSAQLVRSSASPTWSPLASTPVEGERLAGRDHEAVHPRGGEAQVGDLVVLQPHLVGVELAQLDDSMVRVVTGESDLSRGLRADGMDP